MLIKLTATTLLALTLFACKKKDETPFDPDAGYNRIPSTLAQYDNTNFGTYVGALVGSSGTVVFWIKNGDNNMKAELNMKDPNVKETLTTTANVTLGQPINNVLFTGPTTSMRFSANADGSNPRVTNIQIPGHPKVDAFLIKESSGGNVRTWEGTSTGTPKNTVTLVTIVSAQPVYALSRFEGDTTAYRGNTTINLSSFTRGKAVINMVTLFGTQYFLEVENRSGDLVPVQGFYGKWNYTNDFTAATQFNIKRMY